MRAAALDIGGTKIAACIADAGGPLLRITEPTLKSGTPDTIARQGLRLIDECCARLQVDPASVQALGVSSCGPFERTRWRTRLRAAEPVRRPAER